MKLRNSKLQELLSRDINIFAIYNLYQIWKDKKYFNELFKGGI